MCELSACARVTGADDLDNFEPYGVMQVSSGREPLSTSPLERITERSMKFCSSRTLPGQECHATAAMNSSEMAVIGLRMRAP